MGTSPPSVKCPWSSSSQNGCIWHCHFAEHRTSVFYSILMWLVQTIVPLAQPFLHHFIYFFLRIETALFEILLWLHYHLRLIRSRMVHGTFSNGSVSIRCHRFAGTRGFHRSRIVGGGGIYRSYARFCLTHIILRRYNILHNAATFPIHFCHSEQTEESALCKHEDTIIYASDIYNIRKTEYTQAIILQKVSEKFSSKHAKSKISTDA